MKHELPQLKPEKRQEAKQNTIGTKWHILTKVLNFR